MKRITIFITLIISVLFISCEENETGPTLNPTKVVAPAIQGITDGSSYTLLQANASDNFPAFTWTPVDFGFDASVTYTLQVDKAGRNFSQASNFATTTGTSITYTIGQINTKFLLMGLVENASTQIVVRVRATISSNVDPIYSDSVKIAITPYEEIINYPQLWVPGGYCGWNHSTCDFLYSVKDDGKYEGYINFTDATTEFKLTKIAGWEEANTIGDPDGGGQSGTLQIGSWGGNNIKVTNGPGYFKINANLNEATYTTMKTDWGIIGSATAGGWGSDQNMTYDPTTKIWSATIDLVVGEIKFRANDDWALNYGDNEGDFKVEAGGSNIAITSAGNYTITLNLSKPPYKYRVTKN